MTLEPGWVSCAKSNKQKKTRNKQTTIFTRDRNYIPYTNRAGNKTQGKTDLFDKKKKRIPTKTNQVSAREYETLNTLLVRKLAERSPWHLLLCSLLSRQALVVRLTVLLRKELGLDGLPPSLTTPALLAALKFHQLLALSELFSPRQNVSKRNI